MKIVHLCLGNFYVDNHTYQENLLPKAHKQLGYEVEIIAGTLGFDKESSKFNSTKIGNYVNEFGIQVTRLPYLWNCKISKLLRLYRGVYKCLDKAQPDIIFIHNCQFTDINIIVSFLKKHPTVKVFVDNHADINNSATNWISLNILHRIIWKKCAHKIEPYTNKFYGVLPNRVHFLTDIYKLPPHKCELLVMGADDDLIRKVSTPETRSHTRNNYQIQENDFLIVTGGKINWARPETLNLMEAVANLKDSPIKLIVFGDVAANLKEKFYDLCQSPNIIYAGWLDTENTYRILASSDLAVFPGLHSVLWEQTCALGIPCIFKDINGVHHVNLNGNALFLKDVSTRNLEKELLDLTNNPEKYESMRIAAKKNGPKYFSYLDIAERSILI